MRIVTSGVSGQHGHSGRDGSGHGGHGTDGGHGQNGTSARPIDVTLTCPSGGAAASVSGSHSGNIPCQPDSVMFCAAVGGAGGSGGRGGDGASGRPGIDGRDATKHSRGTDGTPGGPGGNGGRGGDGGDAGDGANIRVRAGIDDMDLFAFMEAKPMCHGGGGGSGGSGGHGGSGGRGGRGGHQHTWTESVKDANGNSRTETRHTDGGHDGSSGPSGSSGSSGRSGRDGANGDFCFVVGGGTNNEQQQYPWRYAPHIGFNFTFHDDTTDDGIYEPGEMCQCNYTLTNRGPMPTPQVQKLFCSLFPNEWITNPSTSNAVDQYVPSSASTNITEPVTFLLQDITEAPPNVVFKEKTNASWSVKVERANKFFSKEELGADHVIDIQHPVRLSKTHGAATVSRSEVAPIAICLHNLCSRTVGNAQNRVCRIRMTIVTDEQTMTPLNDPNIATLIDVNENPIPYLDVPIDSISPSTNLIPGAFLKFHPYAADYSKVTFGVELFFGHVSNFMQERRIQRMTVGVQLAEYYKQMKNTNFIVCTNHSTSKETFEAWNMFAPRAGLRVNFFNATIHGGISMEQQIFGTTLAKDLSGGCMMIENNDPGFLQITRTERNADEEHAFDTVSAREISYSMREHQVGFAVIGKSPNARKKLVPADTQMTPIPPIAARSTFGRLKAYVTGKTSNDADYWLPRIHSVPHRPEGNANLVDKMEKPGQGASGVTPSAVAEGAAAISPSDGETAVATPPQHSPSEGETLLTKQQQQPPAVVEFAGYDKVDFKKLHKELEDRHGYSSSVAWQILHGAAVCNGGEELLQVAVDRADTFEENLTRFMNWYFPVTPDVIKAMAGAAGSDQQKQDVMFRELKQRFGGPEPQFDNTREYISGYAQGSRVRCGNDTYARSKLVDAGNNLYERVSEARPNWRFMVIYEVAPHSFIPPQATALHSFALPSFPSVQVKLMPSDGALPGKYCYGRLSIRRSVNRNASSIQHIKTHAKQLNDPSMIMSRPVLYASLKGLPFWRRLDMIHDDTVLNQSPDNFGALTATLLSDLVEEQIAVRRHNWSWPIAESDLLEHLPMLCCFAKEALEVASMEGSATGAAFHTIASRLRLVVDKWVHWSDKIMLCRRNRFATNVALTVLGPVMKKLPAAANTEPPKNEQAEMTCSELVQWYAAGSWFDRSLFRSSQNMELMARVVDKSWLDGVRAQEKPAEIVVGKFELNSPREKYTMLHKLCSDFNCDGEVDAKISRTKQNQRLAYLLCPKRHQCGDVSLQELNALATQGTQIGCGICLTPVVFDPAQVMCPPGWVVPVPKRCNECNNGAGWWVCSDCMLVAEMRKWCPVIENADTEAKV